LFAYAGLQEEIQAANVKFTDAFAKGDADAMAALYTSDCKVMPPGSDVIEGQQGTYYSILPPQYCYNMEGWAMLLSKKQTR
jgi:hypothetical protein